MVQTTAHNSSYNLPSYPSDNQHCLDSAGFNVPLNTL